MVVRFGGSELELGDQTVELIDDEDGFEIVQPCLTENGDGLSGETTSACDGSLMAGHATHLCANAFDNIDQYQRTIT